MKKIGEIMRTMGRALHLELTEHRSTFLVYSVLRIAVIVTMVLQFLNRNYENVFLCLLTLLLLVLPGFLQMTFRIELPKVLEIIILVFIFSAEILGEINEFYLKFPYWDTVLHTMNGFFGGSHRFFPGGSAEPEQKGGNEPFSSVCGYRLSVFFHDHRSLVGIL